MADDDKTARARIWQRIRQHMALMRAMRIESRKQAEAGRTMVWIKTGEKSDE